MISSIQPVSTVLIIPIAPASNNPPVAGIITAPTSSTSSNTYLMIGAVVLGVMFLMKNK